jgi:hypothetical protein
MGLPLVSMVASLDDHEVGPQIHVWVEPNEHDGLGVVETHRCTYGQLYGPVLKGFTFEEWPKLGSFVEHDASACTVQFTYEGTSGVIAPARLRSISSTIVT